MLGFSPISAAPISWPGNFFEISVGGIAAGATLSGTSTLSAGSATGDSGAVDATAPGATLTGSSTLSAGAASGEGIVNGTAPGANLTGTSSIQAGTASNGTYVRAPSGAGPRIIFPAGKRPSNTGGVRH